ncbi:ABC transporter ATP-binding protein [Clostridium sp. CCUG 7971]|uniref:ABC transporter ATP-binding protein n=1 Tax=Clostridium sp. CCUG 7971 TaxID=2811414 RepID=UPI001ABA1DB6|nr:ABC transporter ATP-binding protein [Clostridium sp. CCUG 7971]MBO3444287.1 ABC transporter ATP-binding protein [Clostridium sp. CCUG 7971]
MNYIIDISNINKSYSLGEEKLHVLKDVSFKVTKGEFISILGPSGSGKSTLMNIIGCMDNLDDGSYNLDGKDIAGLGDEALALVRNEKIGFIFQKYHLIPKYSVIQNVMIPLLIRGVDRQIAREKATEKLRLVGLEDRLKHKPNELSGGQQQRVAIARALVSNPAILLADEPTGALDSQTGKEVLALFKELKDQGNTIIMITHDKSVANYGDRIISIIDGNIRI